MDSLILSEESLNQQICTECSNYLSVGPVTVSCQGKILCGRCDHTEDELNVLKHSLYNLVAEKLVFKCINYYGGCKDLLRFDEVEEHEKTCLKVNLKCPLCNYTGNGCQLVHHLHKQHPKSVVKENTVKIIVEDTFLKKTIFIENSNIFCITFSMIDKSMNIFNQFVTPADLGPKHFKLRFFKPGSNIEFVTSPIRVAHDENHFPWSSSVQTGINKYDFHSCLEPVIMDQDAIIDCFPSRWCLCKIELIDEIDCNLEETNLELNFFKRFVTEVVPNLPINISETRVAKGVTGEDFDFNRVLKMAVSEVRKSVTSKLYLLQNCVNCNVYITTVYFCPNYHMACIKCSSSKCSKCNTVCEWSIKPKLNISLACEWSDCLERVNIFKYTEHKRDCKLRRYKCPDVDCGFVGVFKNLFLHWHMNPIKNDEVFKFPSGSSAHYWMLPEGKELFYVAVEFEATSAELCVTVKEVDVVMSRRYNFNLSVMLETKFGDGVFNLKPDKTEFDVVSTEFYSFVSHFKLKVETKYNQYHLSASFR